MKRKTTCDKSEDTESLKTHQMVTAYGANEQKIDDIILPAIRQRLLEQLSQCKNPEGKSVRDKEGYPVYKSLKISACVTHDHISINMHPFLSQDELERDDLSPCHCIDGISLTRISTFGKPEKNNISLGECMQCEGEGVMTLEQRESQEAWRKLWCRCDEKEESDVYYHDNYEGEEDICPDKHHWHCSSCKQIRQIG